MFSRASFNVSSFRSGSWRFPDIAGPVTPTVPTVGGGIPAMPPPSLALSPRVIEDDAEITFVLMSILFSALSDGE